jgi:preprotein translocase subunit SecG
LSRHTVFFDRVESMESVLIVIQLLVVLTMIIVILLQRSEGGGLGMGGGQGGGLVSVRGTANLLTRSRAVLATVFFVTSIALAILSANRTGNISILDVSPAAPTAPVEQEQPAQPGVPLSE